MPSLINRLSILAKWLGQVYRSRLNLVGANQFAQLSRQGVAVLVAIALAQAPVSTNFVGLYEQLLYLAYLLSFAWMTGLLQSLLSLYNNKEQTDQRQLLFLAFATFTGLSILLAGLLLWPWEWFLKQLSGTSMLPYLPLVGVYFLLYWPGLLIEQLYNLRGQRAALIRFASISNGAYLLAVAVPAFLGRTFHELLLYLLAWSLCKYLWLIGLLVRHSQWNGRLDLWLAWLRPAAPLVLYAFLGALSVSFDPWFVVQQYGGETEPFALYRYGSRELPLVAALGIGVLQAVLPQFGSQSERALNTLRVSSIRLMHGIFPVSIILLLTADWWFVWIFTTDFSASVPIFQTILLVTSSRLVFASVPIIGMQHSYAMPFLIILSLGGNALFSLLLFPYFGLLGIAWGTVLAFSLEKWGMVLYVRYRLQIPLSKYCGTNWLLLYTILLLLAYGGTTLY